MQLTLLKGYPDFVGKRATFVGYGSGPASYVQLVQGVAPAAGTGGDPLTFLLPNYYIDSIDSAGVLTVSGKYFVRAISSGVGARQKWALVWYVTTGGAEVGAGVILSAEQIQIGGKCGQY
jgi:hypothetical protein